MTDAKKRIEVTFGPSTGRHFDAPAEEADKAIAEGWARDPHAMTLSSPPTRTEEERAKLVELATAGAGRLTGDKPQAAKQEAPAKPEPTNRAMESGSNPGYPTRTTRK